MLPTGNCSHHGSVEGGGWTKQDNKQGGVQVKGSERCGAGGVGWGGVTCQK